MKIWYGGDYNPEQWPEEAQVKDMELLKEAGIDIVTLNVFNWALLQPSEEVYDFSVLDRTVERVTKAGMHICMATSTAAHPAWMAKRYPDILRTDFQGRKRKFGGRHNSCPNSPSFQRFAPKLAGKIAEHYNKQENILLWHVSNEYEGACYCENCEKAFRLWLKEKYKTLENLNKEWNTCFWGHIFYDWDEIAAPNLLSEHFEELRSMNQPITLDYMRFNSDSMLHNFREEKAAVMREIPNAVVTTNFMGAYKPLDYKRWAPCLDIISWDNYPPAGAEAAYTAMNHDLMRGLKGGQAFLLMEQTPSVCNWLTDNRLKRPGVMRLQSYQAVAHGADAVMFFQMRRSAAGCEKFHGAVIDHAGRNDTRVFKECRALGEELRRLGDATLSAVTPARAALIFDWDTWWALECSAGPNIRLRYLEEFYLYYKAFYAMQVPVDIIGMEDALSPYSLVAAPLLYMIKNGADERLKCFVSEGGSLLLGYMSGYVNENDRITTGGYPGKLRELAGIWVEEIDSLPEEVKNSFQYKGKEYEAALICDLMHSEGAETLASYTKDFYSGMPVITVNRYGKGRTYYMGTRSEEAFYTGFLKDIAEECGLLTADGGRIGEGIARSQKGVEITRREKEGVSCLFVLNHSDNAEEITLYMDGTELLSGREICAGGRLRMEPKEVFIVETRTRKRG